MATFGGALLALVAIKDLLDHFRSLPRYYQFMAAAGMFIVVVAFAAAALWFARAFLFASSRYVWTDYSVGSVWPDQLDDFHAFCGSILGDDVASLDRLRLWHQKNPATVSAIYQDHRRGLKHKRRMVGFFSVFPVTKEAKELLSLNQLKGTELIPQQIVSRGHRAAALYIGGVGAKGFRARERTLGALMGHVAILGQKTPLVFTRPVTKDGLRIARQQGFEPVMKGADPSVADGAMVFVRDLALRPAGSE
jgi:hypothetical protein